jgi:hypothetical protein
MDATMSPGFSSRTGSVRILTSPEELAEAIARAREFERRNAESIATRAQRHEAALARFPSNAAPRWTAPHPATASEPQIPSLPESA